MGSLSLIIILLRSMDSYSTKKLATNECTRKWSGPYALSKDEINKLSQIAENLLEEMSKVKVYSDEELCHIAGAKTKQNKTNINDGDRVADVYMISLRILYNILRKNTLSNKISKDIVSRKVKSILGLTGNSFSVLCLLVLLHTCSLSNKLQSSRKISTVILSILLMLANLLQIMSFTGYNKKTLCLFVAIGKHWIYLSIFSLTFIIARKFYICFGRKISKLTRANQIPLGQIFASFVFSTIFVITCIVINFSRHDLVIYGEEEYCFILSFWANLLSFTIPVTTIVFANTVLLSITGYRLLGNLKSNSETLHQSQSRNREFQAVLAILKVSTLLALPWIFAVISGLTESAAVAYIFLVLNSLQGFFVFVAFCCNKRVLTLYKQRCTISTS